MDKSNFAIDQAADENRLAASGLTGSLIIFLAVGVITRASADWSSG